MADGKLEPVSGGRLMVVVGPHLNVLLRVGRGVTLLMGILFSRVGPY